MTLSLHELPQDLTDETKNMHRALKSLQEELEAVDWYRQRADVCTDEALKAILLHNMREEIEHACMVLEWLRRNSPDFDENLREYLFTEAPITQVEAVAMAREGQDEDASQAASTSGFTIGSLKE